MINNRLRMIYFSYVVSVPILLAVVGMRYNAYLGAGLLILFYVINMKLRLFKTLHIDEAVIKRKLQILTLISCCLILLNFFYGNYSLHLSVLYLLLGFIYLYPCLDKFDSQNM